MTTSSTNRTSVLVRAAGRGAVAGLVGVAAMTASEKVEQSLTGRPDSHVPGRALRELTSRDAPDTDRPTASTWVLHWSTGALLGALRGVWSAVGLRGPRASAVHTVLRLSFDQTVENVSGAGAPPHTWPVGEQVVDVTHKALCAAVTGAVADRWVAPVLESRRGVVSH